MKRNITKFLAALALLVFMTPSLVAWGQTRDEVVAYTLQPASGSNNSYAGNCDITINGITWNLTGNSTTQPWRIGGKSITQVDRPLYSKTAISDNISKIEVTHGAASSITVNSWTVIVASDADFSTVVSTLTPTFAANTTTTINRPDGVDWSNCYYKFIYNVTVSGSSNRFLEFSQAIFYKETGTTLQDSDLSLSPTTLSFDLYDDAEAKTITISTSSTGAISVSDNAYVTTEINGSTITVTPLTNVTPETQTITVTQAADNTYQSGSATFTVDIADSTPFTGGDVTFDAAVDKGTSPLVKNGVTFACNNGVLNNGSEYRLYKNSTTTFSVEQGVITSIAFTGVSGNPASGFATQTGWTTEGNNGTWTGSATSVSFVASGAQVRATQIVVTVDLNATPDPAITANDVNIAYNATEGEITYAIENAVEGATLEAVVAEGATITNFELGTVGDSPITFTCDANNTTSARTATVTLNYVKNDETLATKDVTVTQAAAPETLTTMQAIYNKATQLGDTGGNVNVVFNNWVVSGVSGSTAYVTDNEGKGFIIFKNGHGFKVNDVLSGTVYGITLKLYKNAAEFTTLTSEAEGLTVTENGSVETQYYLISGLEGVNTGALISLNTLTYSSDNEMLSDDMGNTIKPYNSLYSAMSFVDGHTYDVTGIYCQYNTTKEILPRSAEDITESQFYIFLNQPLYGNNTIYADYEYATAGTTVTLTAELEDGYTLAGWKVVVNIDGTIIDEIDVVDNQFVMPANDVNVEAIIAMPCTLRLYCNGGMVYETQDLTILEEIPEEVLWNCYAPEGYEVVGWTASPQTMELIEFPYPLTSDYVDLYSVLAEADPTSSALTIDASTENFPSSYGYDTECMLNGRRFKVNQAYVNGQKLQFKASEGYLYNYEDFGKINSIVLNYHSSDTKKNFTVNAGSTSYPSGNPIEPTIDESEMVYTFDLSNGDYHFFALENGVNAGYLNSIVINYGESGMFTEVIVMEEGNTWYPLANNTLEPWQRLVIKDGAIVQFYEVDNSNGTAANILIEDGGQFITYNGVAATVQKNILGCNYNSSNNSGYYLITPPVEHEFSTVNPYNVKGMLSNEYDLYAYDNTQEYEWRNFKDSESYFTSMYQGEGYLYANSQDVTLEFAGNLLPAYDEESFTTWIQNPGFNLLGNPFTFNVTTAIDYMVLNSEGSGFEVGSGEIKPCEAILVETTESNEEVTLSRQSRSISSVTMNVLKDRGTVVDNARVRFGEGQGMNKFYLNENGTRIFIAQGDNEKAVVYSAAEGEMPVSFKASENGTYTLAVEAENMEMDYLHLIDNMTGMDVDLLQTPSYTFEARTNDYTSRFRLVFKGNSTEEQTTETFAYFNGTSWTVSNLGEATLQVVDVMGRLVSTEQINGNATINLNETPGIYMLRLVNGNDVKVQKIVVR